MATADIAFGVKVGERRFTLSRITLGDWLLLKTHFDLDADDIIVTVKNDKNEDVQTFNLKDPRVLVGLMVCALHSEKPKESVSDQIIEISDLGVEEFELIGGSEDEDDAAPLDDADEATESPAKGSSKAKRPKQPGTQR